MKTTYDWKLADLKKVASNGAKVFSTFACGGGSSMGYKLAGFDVIGCNEIDPKMMAAYKKNLHPKIALLSDIRELVKDPGQLPAELFSLDVLDGSPPCSTFSVTGDREKAWGKKKKFSEGQALQTLDDLFFEFIALAKILQPKIVIAENVKGIILGNAKTYVSQIYRDFALAGYSCQHWLLDSSKMGVPQKRERVFFIAVRNDIKVPDLVLDFRLPEIPFGAIESAKPDPDSFKITPNVRELLRRTKWGSTFTKGTENQIGWFSWFKVHPEKSVPTLLARTTATAFHYSEYRRLDDAELIRATSFPSDYDFVGTSANVFLGMSVPPIMTAQLSAAIWKQWGAILKKAPSATKRIAEKKKEK